MDKLRVIMTGPMPPNVGGMATVLNDLGASKLASQVDLVFLNTAKTTREDRKLTEAVLSKLRLWSDWARLLKSKSKTIAHIHTCSGLTFFLDGVLICLAKCCAVPVVLHVHGAKFDQFLDGLNPVLQSLAKWLFRRCDSVIVLSDSWRAELQNRLGPLHFSVIANGVPIRDDISIQTRSSTNVNVLFLGNLTERKGVFDLLEAMRYVDNAVLHMVGGEEQIGVVEKVNKVVEKLELEEKVVLHGVKFGIEKEQLVQNSDIFVLPSYAEGLPVALLEAMAYALPVIASNVGGIPAVVTNGNEGFLIDAGNLNQLISTLNQLVANRELRGKMGRAARERCQAEFGIDKIAEKLLNLYSEIVACEVRSFQAD